MLKDCVIWEGRGGNDYSPPLVMKSASGELRRVMTAILWFSFVEDGFCLFDSETWEGGWRDLEAENSTFEGLNTLHRHVNKTFSLFLLFIAPHFVLENCMLYVYCRLQLEAQPSPVCVISRQALIISGRSCSVRFADQTWSKHGSKIAEEHEAALITWSGV